MNEMQGLVELEDDTQKNKYLTFSLESESYGIDISCVTEIIGIQPITEVPELPEYIRGIINLRGKIIPVMDVRLRFKKSLRNYDDRTCIVVIDIQNVNIGLIVDRVAEVIMIPEAEMVNPPEVTRGGNQYIKSIGKVGQEVKLILDCDKLLNDRELNEITSLD